MKRLLLFTITIALGSAQSELFAKPLTEVIDTLGVDNTLPKQAAPLVKNIIKDIDIPHEYAEYMRHANEGYEAIEKYIINPAIAQFNAAAATNHPATAITGAVNTEIANLDELIKQLNAAYARITHYIDKLLRAITLTDAFLDTTNTQPLSYFARQYMELCKAPDGSIYPGLKDFYDIFDEIKDVPMAIHIISTVPKILDALEKHGINLNKSHTTDKDTHPLLVKLEPAQEALEAHYFGKKNPLVVIGNALSYRASLNQRAASPRRRTTGRARR